MGKENRRSPRLRSNLPVTILLRASASGANLAAPLTGRINDLSVHGVRLTVPHIRIGTLHLFYSFTDNTRQTIFLEVRLADPNLPPLSLPVRPIWFDHLLGEPAQPFQLGMEFLVPPEDEHLRILNGLLAARSGEHSWWRRLLNL